MNIILLMRTLIFYFCVGVLCLIFIPPLFVIACLPARYRYENKFIFTLLDWFYKLLLRVSFLKINIQGKQNLPSSPAIFVANHQSSADIPVLGSLCNGYPHVWLVLSYYAKTPVMGFFVRRMFIPVDRANAAKAARSLIQIYRFVSKHKRHVLIFPEGTRRTDGKIHEFYGGFAIIAKKTGQPVIPIFMPTTGKIYPPASFYLYSYPLIIIIGEPFYCGEDETEQAFTQRVRQWFLKENEKYSHDI